MPKKIKSMWSAFQNVVVFEKRQTDKMTKILEKESRKISLIQLFSRNFELSKEEEMIWRRRLHKGVCTSNS